MRITIMTLFPEFFDSFRTTSIIKKAIEKGHVELECVDYRQYTLDKHNHVDDTPCGGGVGMLFVVRVAPFHGILGVMVEGAPSDIKDHSVGLVHVGGHLIDPFQTDERIDDPEEGKGKDIVGMKHAGVSDGLLRILVDMGFSHSKHLVSKSRMG